MGLGLRNGHIKRLRSKFYKNSLISPLYKKVVRAKPENYGPIALMIARYKYFKKRVVEKKL